MREFLKHRYLQFSRSPSFGREMGVTILIAIMALFVTFGVVIFALILPRMINELTGSGDTVTLINKMVIYYFIFEFVMRYLIQKVPVLDIEPYLTLPIPRRRISLYLLARSFISLFNAYPAILLTPLAIEIITPAYGTNAAIAWVMAILCISWSLHCLQLMFKNKYEDKPWVWMLLLGVAAGNYGIDYYYGTNLLQPATNFFGWILSNPWISLLPVAFLVFIVYRTYHFLHANLYMEEISAQQKNIGESYSDRLAFLTRRGLIEIFMLQEIRLILRHKRTRSVIVLSLLFIPYGLLFFGREDYGESSPIFILIGIFMSGLFTINYGQFFWGWNTNQLDFFFSRPITLKIWVRSRYRLLVLSAVLSTLLCLPYLYFGWKVMFTLFCCGLFNIGVNIPLMMRMAMWQPKAIDLNKGSFMNYQGTGLAQWIMGIPLLATPYLFYLPFQLYFGHIAGIIAVGFAGIVAFLFRDYLISMLVEKLKASKYQLIKNLIL